jgi:hypothetical protein
MPLADFISEVMKLLGDPNLPGGEILVERVRGERRAERNADYERASESSTALIERLRFAAQRQNQLAGEHESRTLEKKVRTIQTNCPGMSALNQ